MKNLKILSTDKEITDGFDVSLQVKRKLLLSTHLLIPNLDKAYKIYGNCDGIKLTLSIRDYNLLIRTSDLNILYDDQLEYFISPCYKSPDMIEGEFITADFKIGKLSVLFTMEKNQIFELLCVKQVIKVIKFNNSTVLFNYNSEHILGLIDEKSVSSKDKEFRNMADEVFTISYESLYNYFEYNEYARLNYILCGPISNNHEDILKIQIKTMLDSTKLITVDFDHLRINFHLSLFYQILNYFVAGIPNYSANKDTPQDYIKRYRPTEKMIKKEVIEAYFAPKISATVNLKNSFIVLPSTKMKNTLVAHSELNFVYIREKEDLDNGPDVIKRLILDKFEITHAKYEELQQFSSTSQKRKALEPIQFVYENKEYKKTNKVTESYVIG